MKKSSQLQSRKILPPSITFTTWQPIFIPLFFADPKQKRQIFWELELKNGKRLCGKAKKNVISLSKLDEGEYKLHVIVGMPFVFKKYQTYQCLLQITP